MSILRDIRRQLGLTQIELAERLGLRQSTISKLERGALPFDKRTELALQALVTSDNAAKADASEAA